MKPAYDDGTVSVFHADHSELAAHLYGRESVGALVTDPPYSDRTHAGHNGVTEAVNGLLPAERDGTLRRGLAYEAMTPALAAEMVATWAALDPAWMFVLTDDELIKPFRAAMERSGRLAFQSIPCVIDGMTVCSRRRSPEMVRWGTLRGYHRVPQEVCPWVGGKPVRLIREIVRAYSRAGDLLVDPFCGAGTLGVAVRYEGRRAILADKDPLAVETTIKRLRGERTKPTRDDFPETASHPSLFGPRKP